MARNIFLNKYDIFISYPYEIQSKVLSLYEVLTNLYGLNVWCNIHMTKTQQPISPPTIPLAEASLQAFNTKNTLVRSTSNLNGLLQPSVAGSSFNNITTNSLVSSPTKTMHNQRTHDFINNSKLFIICLNDLDSDYVQCENELSFAIKQKKKILCLLFQNVKILSDLGSIGLLIQVLPRVDFYTNDIITWSGASFDRFIDLVELMLSKKINRTQTIAIQGSQISTAAKLHVKIQPRETQTLNKVVNKTQVRFKQIKSNKPLNLPAKRLTRMTYLPSRRRILYCDSDANLILVTDSYGSFLNKTTLEQLKKPHSICVSSARKHEIYIADNELGRIFVYDIQFKFKRELETLKLHKPFEMTCDNEQNDVLMITHEEKNELLVINGDNGEIIHTKSNIEKPTYVKCKSDNIFIISNLDTIIILRKDTYDTLTQIKFDNWCNIRGLYINNKNQIFTTSYEKNFPIAFLNLIDINGVLLSKVYIHMKEVEDMLVIDDKKFFFNTETSSPCVLEFE